MTRDFRDQLLLQIEMLRAGISHQELSARLGYEAERSLANYIAGKAHLREDVLKKIAEALSIDPSILAQQWASSLGLGLSAKNAVKAILDRAFSEYQKRKRTAGVPPRPSPMVTIRAKYADRLSRETPPLWFVSNGNRGRTTVGCARFARAYEMLLEFVHDDRSQRDIGALRGISGERARQLMQIAAYIWAKPKASTCSAPRTWPPRRMNPSM
jgi:transcriptional regulator with XRE-family HTH domain